MLDLLKSPRFLGLLVIAILQGLVLFNIITSIQGEGLIQIIQAVIAGAVVIRTVDRGGDKAVESSKIVSGMSPEIAQVQTEK